MKQRQVDTVAIITPKGYLSGGDETDELERAVRAVAANRGFFSPEVAGMVAVIKRGLNCRAGAGRGMAAPTRGGGRGGGAPVAPPCCESSVGVTGRIVYRNHIGGAILE